MMIPCRPEDPKSVEISIFNLEPQTVLLPDITEETFKVALNNIKPTVKKQDLAMYDTFTSMYGSLDNRDSSQLFEDDPENDISKEKNSDNHGIIEFPSIPTTNIGEIKKNDKNEQKNQEKEKEDSSMWSKIISLF